MPVCVIGIAGSLAFMCLSCVLSTEASSEGGSLLKRSRIVLGHELPGVRLSIFNQKGVVEETMILLGLRLVLFEVNSALYAHPVVSHWCFSTVNITPSESQSSSLRKMIKFCAFSSIDY
ncbi:MAG: hypothetical protein PVH74_08455 [Desulfobacterales bacterium]|jgi:hypothetical protein